MLGFLLLVGSLVCVNLNRFLKSAKTSNYSKLFSIFEFLSPIFDMIFLRKQNLVNQETQTASTRAFKKKTK